MRDKSVSNKQQQAVKDLESPLVVEKQNDYDKLKNETNFKIKPKKVYRKIAKQKKNSCNTDAQSLKKHYFIATVLSLLFGVSAFLLLKNHVSGNFYIIFLYATLIIPSASTMLIFLWRKILNILAGSLLICESLLFFVFGFHMLIETSSNLGKNNYFENPEQYMKNNHCECWSISEVDAYCNISSELQKCEDQMVIFQLISTYTIVVGFIIISVGLYIIIGTCLYYDIDYESREDENESMEQDNDAISSNYSLVV